MKNLIIAVLVAIILVNGFGHLADDWFGMHIVWENETLTPFASMLIVGALAVVMAIVGFIVACSVFGVLALTFVGVLIGLLVAGITAFWPMLLIAALIIWMVKQKNTSYSNT
ncbi:hypothetical protein [Aestuariibacter salexigens]|uniref:hypothetical protein n=1 Tax=Aestuariibacter salexigens TaxID=226010 RepID=UPI0004014F52|nr:hypothetical protein [Aestuariibacter salexigens]